MATPTDAPPAETWGLPHDRYTLYDGVRRIGIEWKTSLGDGLDLYVAHHPNGRAAFLWMFDGNVETLLDAAESAVTGPPAPLSRVLGESGNIMARHAAVLYGARYLGDTTIRVKTTRSHHIDLMRTIYNWRLVTTRLDNPLLYDRGWCYTGRDSLHRAYAEAYAWPDDDAGTHVPYGWYKQVGSDVIQPQFRYE